ncbi:MAG: type II toxin-antitoxin system RelE/ParE family toxin [Bacteroidales bacterium]
MNRQIVFHEEYFFEFYEKLDMKIKAKVQYVLELIKQVDRVPEKFLAPITGYEGLFEIRIEYQSNIYRIFCCFDEGRLVILFNGFQKKTQKTPKKEIEKAVRLMKEYFQTKNRNHD